MGGPDDVDVACLLVGAGLQWRTRSVRPQNRDSRSRNHSMGQALTRCAGCEQNDRSFSGPPTDRCRSGCSAARAAHQAPPEMTARQCAARATANTDAVTRAQFEQEEQQWLARLHDMLSPSREALTVRAGSLGIKAPPAQAL